MRLSERRAQGGAVCVCVRAGVVGKGGAGRTILAHRVDGVAVQGCYRATVGSESKLKSVCSMDLVAPVLRPCESGRPAAAHVVPGTTARLLAGRATWAREPHAYCAARGGLSEACCGVRVCFCILPRDEMACSRRGALSLWLEPPQRTRA